MLKLIDDLGRSLMFGRPPARVVSLVPSDTHSVIALGARARLVGRTTYCESPEAHDVPTVGGTKNVDVEAVAARTKVLVSLPRRVDQGVAHLARLARILGVEQQEPARSLIKRGYAI